MRKYRVYYEDEETVSSCKIEAKSKEEAKETLLANLPNVKVGLIELVDLSVDTEAQFNGRLCRG